MAHESKKISKTKLANPWITEPLVVQKGGIAEGE